MYQVFSNPFLYFRSIFVYQKTDSGWKIERNYYGALHYGAWGEGPGPDEAAYIHLSPEHCALALRGGYLNQGWYEEVYNLYLPYSRGLRHLFRTTMTENSGGSGITPATNWDTEIRLRPGEREYYDIHLHRHGIKKGEKVDYNVTYRYDGKEYKPDRPDPLAQ